MPYVRSRVTGKRHQLNRARSHAERMAHARFRNKHLNTMTRRLISRAVRHTNTTRRTVFGRPVRRR